LAGGFRNGYFPNLGNIGKSCFTPHGNGITDAASSGCQRAARRGLQVTAKSEADGTAHGLIVRVVAAG
jgi:hypothetical protein